MIGVPRPAGTATPARGKLARQIEDISEAAAARRSASGLLAHVLDLKDRRGRSRIKDDLERTAVRLPKQRAQALVGDPQHPRSAAARDTSRFKLTLQTKAHRNVVRQRSRRQSDPAATDAAAQMTSGSHGRALHPAKPKARRPAARPKPLAELGNRRCLEQAADRHLNTQCRADPAHWARSPEANGRQGRRSCRRCQPDPAPGPRQTAS